MTLPQSVIDAWNKNAGGGGRQPALPDGTRVRAIISTTKKDEGFIHRRPFSNKPENPNHSIESLGLRFVIPADWPHANRNFFADVPTEFEIFDRNGGKIPSYQSINLLQALGYDLADVDANTIKNLQDRELLNKPVDLVLGVEEDRQFNAADPAEVAKANENPLYAKRNNVKFINAPTLQKPAGGATSGGYASAARPQGAPAVASVDPWAGGQQAQQQAAPQQGYAPQVQQQQPQQAAPAGDPWAGAGAAASSDPWANAGAGATV